MTNSNYNSQRVLCVGQYVAADGCSYWEPFCYPSSTQVYTRVPGLLIVINAFDHDSIYMDPALPTQYVGEFAPAWPLCCPFVGLEGEGQGEVDYLFTESREHMWTLYKYESEEIDADIVSAIRVVISESGLTVTVVETPKGEELGFAEAIALDELEHYGCNGGDTDGNSGWMYNQTSSYVYPYHINVPQFLGVEIPEELCLGIEAEFLSAPDCSLQATLENIQDKAIFKSDSSCGVELVSIPMVPSDMVEYVSNLQISHLNVDSTCGVHIHLSRKYLTQSQLGGLVVFMNHPGNLSYVQAVAGRPANLYCKQIPGKTDTVSSDRYEMINLTNAHTIEVRIFAGTNQVGTLTGYVTWLVSLIKWLGTNPSNYSFTEFLAYSES